MKLIPVCCFTFLLLSVLLPKEGEGLAPLIMGNLGKLAAQQSLTLAKMTYYAQCDTVNEPPDIKCPSDVYGIGMKPDQAKMTARIYATMFGDDACALYVGECRTYKFLKAAVQVVKELPKIVAKLPKIKIGK